MIIADFYPMMWPLATIFAFFFYFSYLIVSRCTATADRFVNTADRFVNTADRFIWVYLHKDTESVAQTHSRAIADGIFESVDRNTQTGTMFPVMNRRVMGHAVVINNPEVNE